MGSPTGEPDTQTAGGCKRLAQTWKWLKRCLVLLIVRLGGYRRSRRIFYEILCAVYCGELSLVRSVYSGSRNLQVGYTGLFGCARFLTKISRWLEPFEFAGCQTSSASTAGFIVWCRFTLAMAESGGLLNCYLTYLPNRGGGPRFDSSSSPSLGSGWV